MKTALVFGGGAARGAYEIGTWQAVRELGIPIQMICGTSIGALNGALLAQGDFQTARRLWLETDLEKVFEMEGQEGESPEQKTFHSYLHFFKSFFSDGGTDMGLLKKALGSFLDEEKLRRSPVDFGLVTVCVEDRKPLALFKDEVPRGKLIDYIFAGCCVAPAFKPYVIDGKRYIDGCYYDNLPVRLALRRAAERIIAVDLEAFGFVDKKLLEDTPNLTLIRASEKLDNGFCFDRKLFARMVELGYRDALEILKDWPHS
ncbi:MAG: patatin-like phospholipase family protein [Peptococcaceae bacterium]|nr:patatin-like phospholipase family protein [Peptococcaceae bacterium]